MARHIKKACIATTAASITKVCRDYALNEDLTLHFNQQCGVCDPVTTLFRGVLSALPLAPTAPAVRIVFQRNKPLFAKDAAKALAGAWDGKRVARVDDDSDVWHCFDTDGTTLKAIVHFNAPPATACDIFIGSHAKYEEGGYQCPWRVTYGQLRANIECMHSIDLRYACQGGCGKRERGKAFTCAKCTAAGATSHEASDMDGSPSSASSSLYDEEDASVGVVAAAEGGEIEAESSGDQFDSNDVEEDSESEDEFDNDEDDERPLKRPKVDVLSTRRVPPGAVLAEAAEQVQDAMEIDDAAQLLIPPPAPVPVAAAAPPPSHVEPPPPRVEPVAPPVSLVAPPPRVEPVAPPAPPPRVEAVPPAASPPRGFMLKRANGPPVAPPPFRPNAAPPPLSSAIALGLRTYSLPAPPPSSSSTSIASILAQVLAGPPRTIPVQSNAAATPVPPAKPRPECVNNAHDPLVHVIKGSVTCRQCDKTWKMPDPEHDRDTMRRLGALPLLMCGHPTCNETSARFATMVAHRAACKHRAIVCGNPGCKVEFLVGEVALLDSHRATCMYRVGQCFIKNCTWCGSLGDDFARHCVDKHGASVITEDVLNVGPTSVGRTFLMKTGTLAVKVTAGSDLRHPTYYLEPILNDPCGPRARSLRVRVQEHGVSISSTYVVPTMVILKEKIRLLGERRVYAAVPVLAADATYAVHLEWEEVDNKRARE